MVSRAPAEGFRSAAFYSAVEDAILVCVPVPPSVDPVSANVVSAFFFMVPLDKFVKDMVEKNSVDFAKMELQLVKLAEAAKEKKSRVEDGIPTKSLSAIRSLGPSTDISDNKVASLKAYSN